MTKLTGCFFIRTKTWLQKGFNLLTVKGLLSLMVKKFLSSHTLLKTRQNPSTSKRGKWCSLVTYPRQLAVLKIVEV